jgi:hypothetical protein
MGAAAAVAGIGAAASIGGSLLSSNAQSSAANKAAGTVAQQQAQTRSDLLPYNFNGQTANRILVNSLYGGDPGVPNLLSANGFAPNGTGGSNLTFQPTQAQLEATPGYQFIRDQGLESVQNSAAARGLGTSGAALKGAASYATGLASTTLGQQQQIFQQNLANVLNPLEYVANQGENAAATTGQQGTTAAANQGAAIIGGGNAQAAGTVGAANALGGLPANYLLYQNLLGNGSGSGNNNFYTASGNNAPGAAEAATQLGSYY